MGLSTLAAAVGEEPDTVEDVVEPYLMQLGFLKRTPRGRVGTERAFRHLGDRDARHPAPLAAAFRRFGRSEGRLRADRSTHAATATAHTEGHTPMIALIAQASSSNSNPIALFLPLILMGGVFYFLLIRPQQKRVRAQPRWSTPSRWATRS